MGKTQIEDIYNNISSLYTLDKDIEYYPAVREKLRELKEILRYYNADAEIINTVDRFRKTLLQILREYYKGNIALSLTKMINQINAICKEDKDAVNDINDCNVFDGDKSDIPFFRARLDADEDGFTAKDMGVIPFCLRDKATTGRFSMPGFPCLYLGNTSYVCWLEMGKPAEFRFNVSPVLLDRTQKLFDLTVSFGYLFERDNKGNRMLSKDITIGFIKRIMLSICSFFRVKEQNRQFKSEYIIPQLIMMACKKCGLDGIAYISSKISNPGLFGVCAINVALYSKYPNNIFCADTNKSALEEHVKIGDAFNYSMYNQIKKNNQIINSSLWIDRCKWINNIEIRGQQFSYRETKFYEFDRFLFCNWIDK